MDEKEVASLAQDAQGVVDMLGGAWSVDYLEDKEGKWWLIDMALAKHSFVDHDNIVLSPAGKKFGL